jgi:hypothetical protein
MGIYISGMKLPENFTEIVIYYDGRVSVFDERAGGYEDSGETATEIVGHGRLLDENDICEIIIPVMEKAKKDGDTRLVRMCKFFITALMIADEKIPADKEEL